MYSLKEAYNISKSRFKISEIGSKERCNAYLLASLIECVFHSDSYTPFVPMISKRIPPFTFSRRFQECPSDSEFCMELVGIPDSVEDLELSIALYFVEKAEIECIVDDELKEKGKYGEIEKGIAFLMAHMIILMNEGDISALEFINKMQSPINTYYRRVLKESKIDLAKDAFIVYGRFIVIE